MTQIHETMRRFEARGLLVRLWISGWDVAVADTIETAAMAIAMYATCTADAATQIGKLSGINAVEVVQADTLEGHLLYPECP